MRFLKMDAGPLCQPNSAGRFGRFLFWWFVFLCLVPHFWYWEADRKPAKWWGSPTKKAHMSSVLDFGQFCGVGPTILVANKKCFDFFFCGQSTQEVRAKPVNALCCFQVVFFSEGNPTGNPQTRGAYKTKHSLFVRSLSLWLLFMGNPQPRNRGEGGPKPINPQ